MQSPARIILILAVLATILTGVGVFSKHWRTAEHRSRELNIGLRTWQECHKGECESATWSDVKGKAGESTPATVGPIAFFIGIGALIALALLAGAIMFAPSNVRTFGAIALGVTAVFLGLSFLYILSFPSEFKPTVGWSAYVAWIAGALGITAGALSLRLRSAHAR